ncbi:MAG TPA: hypothetical protein VGG10_21480 [Rhizomicrobium sp.]|jgi:autotransporter-associated beta strand protein
MATVKWLIGLSGDWNTGTNWTTGTVPGAADDVVIDFQDTYTVNLTSTATIASLDLAGGLSCTLSQAAAAPLTMTGSLTVDESTATLRAANVIGGPVFLENFGTIDVANNKALGNAALFNTGGFLEAIANVTLSNQIATSDQAFFTAGTNKTLSLTGQFSAGGTVFFGNGTTQGTVDFAPSSLSVGSGVQANIFSGTLKMGSSAAVGLLSAATSVGVVGVLDMNGHAAEIAQLFGGGLVTNSATGTTAVKIDGGEFSGDMTGALAVEIAGTVEFDSALHYTGGTTIDASALLNLGSLSEPSGSVTGAIVDNGLLEVSEPLGLPPITLANSISGSGALRIFLQSSEELIAISHANSYLGGTYIFGRVLLGNAGGLGTGAIRLDAGGIEATQTETITNAVSLGISGGFSADAGKTLTVDSAWTVGDDASIVFGGPNGPSGTVVVRFESLSTGSNDHVFIKSGTVAAADTAPLLAATVQTTIDAGATFDVRGHAVTIENLQGAGTIANGGGMATLTIGGGHFSGGIKGAFGVDFTGSTILGGANVYNGGTTVTAGVVLALGNGGTTGSVTGPIDDEGTLISDRSNALSIDHVISGAGLVEQRGTGTTTLSATNTFSGAVIVTAGALVSGHADALGSAEVIVQGGTLLGTVSQTIGNLLVLTGHDTLAAATGKTLTFSDTWDVSDDTALVFGSSGHAGTLSVTVTGGSLGAHTTATIAAGTVALANVGAAEVIGSGDSLTVGAAGILDLNGHAIVATDLLGSGTIRSTGAATLTVQNASFAGHIDGNIAVVVDGTAKLTGGGNFTGGATVEANAALHLVNAAPEDVTFAGTIAQLILDTPSSFTGTIGGMVHTDKIDLTTIASATAHLTFNATTDVMTVTDGTHTAHLQFVDGYVQNDFGLSDDGHGHTFVTTSVTTPPHLPDMDALI